MDIKDVLDRYSTSFIQDFLTLLRMIKEDGISLDDALNIGTEFFRENILSLAENSKNIIQDKNDFRFNAKRCPSCGLIMHPYPVNETPGTQVGGNYKMSWMCVDFVGCGESEYSENTVQEELEKYSLGKFYTSPIIDDEINRNRRNRRAGERQMRPRQFRIKNLNRQNR